MSRTARVTALMCSIAQDGMPIGRTIGFDLSTPFWQDRAR
jgi:hypothetical protein